MDHRTRTDLLLMTLELRLAACAPSELVGRRLSSQRLQDIAAALEERLDALGDEAAIAQTRPANDIPKTSEPQAAIRQRGRA